MRNPWRNKRADDWWPRLLARLLPSRIRRDLFYPAWQDARFALLTRRLDTASSSMAALLRLRYSLTLVALFADCWRLALMIDVRTAAARVYHLLDPTPSLPAPRKQEIAAVLQYHLKHALRRLVREPGFTMAAVFTLALGVGANASVFAVVEAVLLRPLPYPNADQLVIVRHRDPRTSLTKDFIAMGDYVDLARDQKSFATFAAYGNISANIVENAELVPIHTLLAGPHLLETVGVRPILGRALTPDDSRDGAANVVMLGADFWKRQYHGDPAMVGRSIRIGKNDYTVVGIAPSGFSFPPTSQVDVITPFGVPVVAPSERRNEWSFVVARLAPGVTLDKALRELTALSTRMAHDFPLTNQASTYFAVPLRDALVGDTKKALTLLLAAVAVVLLIACANVANLLLARSLGRRREMAVKMALGAGRARLAVQLLSESAVLSTVAGLAGVVMAYWGSHALVALIPQADNIPGLGDVHINGTVLAFALGITVLTSLVFALVSLLTVRVEDGTGVLVAAGRVSMSTSARRATSGLVAIEIALAIMLLIGAGLITKSFAGLLAVNPGFKYDQVATIGVTLPSARYPDGVARRLIFARLLATLSANPAVRDVGSAEVTPLTGNNWSTPFARAEVPLAAGEQPPEVGWQMASAGYFKALQIPLLAGRLFNEHDVPPAPPVVIISEAIQKRFYGNESAVGKHIVQDGKQAEIIGVVGNIRRAGLNDEPRPDLYMSLERSTTSAAVFFIHTTKDAEQSIPALRAAIKEIEPGVVLHDARTLADIAGESVRVTKLMLWLLAVFAVTALALAAVGIYGVMSYVVRQRTREIGTRIALGATRRNILWLVMKQGAAIAAIGTVAGVGAGVAATRLLSSVLYNVSPTDPLTMALAATVLLATSMSACYLPARRATSVDPARTLTDQ